MTAAESACFPGVMKQSKHHFLNYLMGWGLENLPKNLVLSM